MRLGSIRHFIQALSSRPGSLFGHSSFGVFCQSVISLRYPKHPTPCFWVRKVLHDHATLFGARLPLPGIVDDVDRHQGYCQGQG